MIPNGDRSLLGQGVYPLGEVVRYTGVPSSTLRSWFLPRSDKKGNGPIFTSQHGRVEDDFAVSFVNLIEAYAAAFFKSKGLKPHHIRRVHEILKHGWHIDHPFASQDLRVDPDAKRLILSKANDEGLVDVLRNQLVLETVRPYLVSIDYNTTTRLAERWHIADGVVINPKVGFGKPVVNNTGVSTLIVANQYVANDCDAALVARLYGIDPTGVVQAYEFERKIKRIAA